MGINCKFLKECQYLNCTNSYNIYLCVKCVQLGVKKENRKRQGVNDDWSTQTKQKYPIFLL